MRNQIMRRIKFEQLKKKWLRHFIRETKAEIIAERLKQNASPEKEPLIKKQDTQIITEDLSRATTASKLNYS